MDDSRRGQRGRGSITASPPLCIPLLYILTTLVSLLLFALLPSLDALLLPMDLYNDDAKTKVYENGTD